MRKFDTGATRNQTGEETLDYNQYLSPVALQRYAEYMKKHALQDDGTYRDGDNWKKGIPLSSFINSGSRHYMDWWLETEGHPSRDGIEEALCGLLFNVMGFLHETLQASTKDSGRSTEETLTIMGDGKREVADSLEYVPGKVPYHWS